MTNRKYQSHSNKFLSYTSAGLGDSIFFDLCTIQISAKKLGKEVDLKIIIPDRDGDMMLKVSKYFERATRLAPFIIVGKPTPYFVIDKVDINPDHLNALSTYHPYHQKMLIKQIGVKIFEIVCPNICYGSIVPKLKVKIPGVIET